MNADSWLVILTKEHYIQMFGNLKKARNPYTNFVTLRDLSESKNPILRAAVAGNPNTQAYIMEELATDSNVKVRLALIENENLSAKAWDILESDENEKVRAKLYDVAPTRPNMKDRRS